MTRLLCIAGPTASGKSARAVREALAVGGEIISVDSRQVYRGLDIGTEKILAKERQGVPHHLIDIREPEDAYSAGEFVKDAEALIREISARKKLPILVGGTHFYFDALLKGLPQGTDIDPLLREQLEERSTADLFARVKERDPRRAAELDPKNRRRIIRALEIITALGHVPSRPSLEAQLPSKSMDIVSPYITEWIVIDPPKEELRQRIDARLQSAFARGLVEEVRRVRTRVATAYGSPGMPDMRRGDARLNELGLEYRIVGEYLRGEREEASLLPALSAKLWQYARRQKAWLRKLADERVIEGAASRPGKS